MGYSSRIIPHMEEPSMRLFVNGEFLARIVEGCNSISIIILFSSFVLAFFARVKTTLFFILAGAVVIYGMNLIRIAVLAVGIYEYPQHTEFLHSIIFPLIIYGTVFLLWILWVRIYSKLTAHEDAV
jgi:exosortase family protein XrtF